MIGLSDFGKPYILFPCDEGEGSTLTGQISTGGTIDLDLTGSEVTTWSVADHVTFDGTNYFSILNNDIPAAAQSILTLGSEALLIGFLVTATSSANKILLRCGDNTNGLPGYEVRTNGSQYLQAKVRSSTLGLVDTATGSSAIVPATNLFAACVLNNQQSNPLVGQGYFFADMKENLGNVDFSSIGPVPFDTTTETNAAYTSIGAGMWNDAAELGFVGSIRNLFIMALDSPMPMGISKFIQQLAYDNGTAP